ncbi:MAG TPA: polyprenyl synthetase family protein [Bacteroidota bacterium]|nr:polyprenyl synthetase family protein [Bacteroidota bacterium]
MNFDQRYVEYKSLVDAYLRDLVRDAHPRSLYQPIRYVLSGGGKRVRSVLVLLACEAVGGTKEQAIHASAAMECLHNFTLVHDDIMDNASSRRGRATVHTKWDSNVAILVGDELLALAFRTLLRTQSDRIHDITKVFTEGVVEVCEGQAYDKDFETKKNVSLDDYLLMIKKKTGKLISVSTELGALVGGGTDEHIQALRGYGERVGRAFQIQDDCLDIMADERELGKTVGSDLQEGKRTFLFLEALRKAKGKDKQLLLSVSKNGSLSRRKLQEFRRIFRETGALDSAHAWITRDLSEAKRELEYLPRSSAREMLDWFTDMLLHRTH